MKTQHFSIKYGGLLAGFHTANDLVSGFTPFPLQVSGRGKSWLPRYIGGSHPTIFVMADLSLRGLPGPSLGGTNHGTSCHGYIRIPQAPT